MADWRPLPCKVRTRILAGSWQDPVGIPARLWPSGVSLPGENLVRRDLAGKRSSWRPKSLRDSPVEKFRWTKSCQYITANLPHILARKQKSWRPKSHQDPTTNIPMILTEKLFSGRQILARSHWESHQYLWQKATFLVRFTVGISAKLLDKLT